MASNRNTRVFDTIAELLGSKGVNNTNAFVLGYHSKFDHGGGELIWDAASTETADDFMIFEVAGVATGRWKRNVDTNVVNVKWGGARADFRLGWMNEDTQGTDNSPIFDKAIAIVEANPQKFRSIMWPYDSQTQEYRYLLKSYHIIRKVDHIFGYAVGSPTQRVPLVFSKNIDKPAFIFYHPNHDGGGQYNATIENLDWLPNVHVSPGYQPFVDGCHGLWADNRIFIRNCAITKFKGDGIHLPGNSAGLEDPFGEEVYGTNSNLFKIYDVDCSYNARDGIHIIGGDVNVGSIQRANVVRNGRWGVFDASFLGSHWETCQASDNGVYGGVDVYEGGDVVYTAREATRVTMVSTGGRIKYTDSGVDYYYFSKQDGNLNHEPTPGITDDWWQLDSFPPDGLIPEWDEEVPNYNPGAYVIHLGVVYHTNSYPLSSQVPGVDAAWIAATSVGYNPLKDYTVWSDATTYKRARFYAARKESLNQAPVDDADSVYYTFLGYSDLWGLSYTWASDLQVDGGGSYSTHNVNNQSTFVGCYAEAGQAHSSFFGSTIWLGGFHEEVPMTGGSSIVKGNGLGALSANNLQARGGSVSFGSGTLSDDVGLSFPIDDDPRFFQMRNFYLGHVNPYSLKYESLLGKLTLTGEAVTSPSASRIRIHSNGDILINDFNSLPGKILMDRGDGNYNSIYYRSSKPSDAVGNNGDTVFNSAIASFADAIMWRKIDNVWEDVYNGSSSIPEHQTLSDGDWDVEEGKNATLTLTADRTLAISNAYPGWRGVLVVKQDSTGSWELTLPTGSSVEGDGEGQVTLTGTPDSVDVLDIFYNGDLYYVIKRSNFTEAPFDISALSDLVAWYKADDADGSGSDLIWDDASSGGHDLSSSGLGKPTKNAAALNGHATVSFDGVDDGVVSSVNMPSLSTGVHIYGVMKLDSAIAAGIILGGSVDISSNWQWYFRVHPDNAGYAGGSIGTTAYPNMLARPHTAGTWAIFSLRSDASGAGKLTIVGDATTATGAGTLAATTTAKIRLGVDYYGTPAKITIAEMVVVSRELTTTEQNKVIESLQAKYAL